ncbi:MAG: guanylate kinase [Cellvibrionales bacterium]|nr:guanylate kinase [Cellvibrionales bacterium]
MPPQLPKASLFVISAPSGAGKTSLVNALNANDETLQVSVSHTTRSKREGEVHGEHYHFVEKAEFQSMVGDGVFLEYAEVFGNCYGTSMEWVKAQLVEGRDVILEIDWQGAQQVARLMDCTTIFILPPSIETLKQRLESRSQDNADTIALRMQKAQNEIAHFDAADFLVVNDDFNQALKELQTIISATRLSTSLQKIRHASLISDLLQ